MAIPQVNITPQMPPLWQPPQEPQPTAYQPYGTCDPPPLQHPQEPQPTAYQPYGTPSQHVQVPPPTAYQPHGTWDPPDQQQTLAGMQQTLDGMQERLALLEARISTLNLESVPTWTRFTDHSSLTLLWGNLVRKYNYQVSIRNSALNPDPIFGGSYTILKRLQSVWGAGGVPPGFPVTPTDISLMTGMSPCVLELVALKRVGC